MTGSWRKLALSHAPGDRTEASYLTTDALEKRRDLMAQWSRHVKLPAASRIVCGRRYQRPRAGERNGVALVFH